MDRSKTPPVRRMPNHLPLTGEAIKKAAEVIKNGGLVVYPSDTVYILAVDPTNQKAVNKLLAFKDRWVGKAISIAVLDQKMAEDYVELSSNAKNIYANLLPGPFTVVSTGKHKVARGIEAENGTLGIRIPDNKNIADLVKAMGGPVTATSANLSGRTPNYSIQSFIRPLSKVKLAMIDMLVDAGKLPPNKPSTVIDATESEVKVLRRGDLVTASNAAQATLVSKSVEETEKIAEFLLKKYLNPSAPTNVVAPSLDRAGSTKPLVFGLTGDLGCGKTVFSRKVGHLLGVKEKITSPTFVIYNEYKIVHQVSQVYKVHQVTKFLHFDLYRLSGKHEFEEIDFLNQFTEGTVSCIEWPENMGEENFKKLKEKVIYIPVEFRYVDAETREIRF